MFLSLSDFWEMMETRRACPPAREYYKEKAKGRCNKKCEVSEKTSVNNAHIDIAR